MNLHLFIELFVAAGFVLVVAHAYGTRGAEGVRFLLALLVLGAVRENFVQFVRYLYDFAPLQLHLGKAPLIAAIIWGFSIYLAAVWTGCVREDPRDRRFPTTPIGWICAALFMTALAGFYEPFLQRIEMARWEEGTRLIQGVPWIALIGYPTLTVGFLAIWTRIGWRRPLPFWASVLALAFVHGAGLQLLKRTLDW